MQQVKDYLRSTRDTIEEWLLRMAVSGWLPGKRWLRPVPREDDLSVANEPPLIEIVTHCWRYAHFLKYQLSSLVNYPPTRARVRMTVFYAEEDTGTTQALRFFEQQKVPGVEWNWQAIPRSNLLRRGIGRNMAAKSTTADWIWFTDCDVVFHAGCIDGLATALKGRRDILVHPQQEFCSSMLIPSDPMLAKSSGHTLLVDVETKRFMAYQLSRATGPMQITHGDVARAVGYCAHLSFYQQPTDRWRKCYEDRAYRWLLGTQGAAIDVPGVYRIRHVEKGRYNGSPFATRFRSTIRRVKAKTTELWLTARKSSL